jgi:hypothetical protein
VDVKGQRGQGTIEWIALVLLVALLVIALLALAGARLPGTALADAIAARIACAVSMIGGSGSCKQDVEQSELAAQYGADVAALVAEHAPEIIYEPGELEVPVDFRACREIPCDGTAAAGPVSETNSGVPISLFVHVVDCREPAPEASERAGYDCSDPRSGNLYIQYWTYYADSATLRGVPIAEDNGYHLDDWEGYQVRIGPDAASARASSHHGYNYAQSPGNWGSDAGIGPLNDVYEAVGARPHAGWGPETGSFYVSSGSHAGNVRDDSIEHQRWTPADQIHLIPIEPLAESEAGTGFSITPPWLKGAYNDPESEGT